jgi:hypothetical protein
MPGKVRVSTGSFLTPPHTLLSYNTIQNKSWKELYRPAGLPRIIRAIINYQENPPYYKTIPYLNLQNCMTKMPGLISWRKWELDKTLLPTCKHLHSFPKMPLDQLLGVFLSFWEARGGKRGQGFNSKHFFSCVSFGFLSNPPLHPELIDRIPDMLASSKTNTLDHEGVAFWTAPFLQLVWPCCGGRRLGPARSSTFECGGDLANGIADMGVDGSDTWEVELRWRHGASHHLHANCEETASGGLICVTRATAFAIAWICAIRCCRRRLRSWEHGKTQGEERNVWRVLAAHCHLDGFHIHTREHHKASTIRVGAALLQ